MRRMYGVIRHYAWGSRTALAQLRGDAGPSAHPEAELWLGAHPDDPADVEDLQGRVSLRELIKADPDGELGAGVAGEFDDELPFLLKLLAANEPLSLQAHPSRAQAREGFAREDRKNIPHSAPERNYKDDCPKPELIVALTEFDALAGFRDPKLTARLFAAFNVPALDAYARMLPGPGEATDDALRMLFTTLITLPPERLDTVLPEVIDGCVRYLSNKPDPRIAQIARTTLELSEIYPGDAGVIASMLLNRVTLAPGEGLYLGAGNLHAYLSGLGVEIMANSDNVLRGGLTPKHVDVPELLRVLNFGSVDVQKVHAGAVESGWRRYPTPAAEFELAQAVFTGSPVPTNGPAILVVTRGSVHVDAGMDSASLAAGESVWLSAEDLNVQVSGSADAQLFRAGVPVSGR